ncbi:MAG: phosphate transport system regulatory protein PhoU, partial [Bacteroidetes bacterium]|nr:phosphate transport system regulatory protein PhoU [Bacteroidota bacterium]
MIRFEEELNNLNKLMLQMATVAEEMITKSIKSLVDRNIILAEDVIRMDKTVNDMEIEIDNLCI